MNDRIEMGIREIVSKMDGVTYIYENWQTANVILDKIQLPAVVNVLPASGSFTIGNLKMYEGQNNMIAFLDKTELDFDGTENEDVIDKCKERARDFIIRVNRSNFFKPISGKVPYSVIYDRTDANLTGIMLELELEEKTGFVMCP